MVDTVDCLPHDFSPCLVTDASGRVRYTYTLHEKERGGLVRLKSAAKDYSNLTCHVLKMPSGKTAYMNKQSFSDLAEEVAIVINARPAEEFLIIYHKMPTSSGKDLRKEIARRLDSSRDAERVKFIHWGRHTATNEYRDISNTIIVGPLFYSLAQYEAIGRAAAGRTTSSGRFCEEERALVRFGEIMHNIYQAGCRSVIRKSVNGKCPPANLWIIAPKNTGISGQLERVFPGCKERLWLTPELGGKPKAAYDYLLSAKKTGLLMVTFSDVWKATGYRDGERLWRDFQTNTAFHEQVHSLGYSVTGEGRARCFAHRSLTVSSNTDQRFA